MRKTNVKKKKVAKKKQVRGYKPTGLVSPTATTYGQHADPIIQELVALREEVAFLRSQPRIVVEHIECPHCRRELTLFRT